MALTAAEEAQTRELLAQQAAILSLADSEAAIISNLSATDVSLSDLTAASTINDADLLLIRQGTTDKSIAGSVVKLAATPGDASTTVKGVVELATNTETQTGTDAVRAVTPSTLASVTSTETRAGLVELATTIESQAGTDTVRAVTPSGLSAASIGQGQTAQDVSGSRSVGVTYYNTTSKPILVLLAASGSTSPNASVSINGATAFRFLSANNSGSAISFILSPTHSYIVTTSSATINAWFEYK